MTWDERSIASLAGKVAVITGANGGLGLESARMLAKAGAHVVMAARNQEKTAAAHDRLLTAVPGASLSVVHMDLGSQDAVRAAAANILRDHQRIDLLINNAGIMATPKTASEDGIELQLATNHIGHFLLTACLFPALARTPHARVITVTSGARHLTRTAWDRRPVDTGRYDPWLAYARSKLANLHFAVELARLCKAAGLSVASLAAHPGVARTDLAAHTVQVRGRGFGPKLMEDVVERAGMSAAHGALPQVRAACDPSARSGDLFAPRFVTVGPPVRRPLFARSTRPVHGRSLWAMSEELIGAPFLVTA